jgi:VIT1/CCC1 family predicted Fe2+/Mn2+ transporter
LQEDLAALRELVRLRGLTEDLKSESREKLAGRVVLLHEVIAIGIKELLAREQRAKPPNTAAPADQKAPLSGR